MHRRLATSGALLVVAVLAGGGAARADAPDQQGWWTATNPGGLPANPGPPDVPADGLLVQGGPSSPSAFAALSYSLPGGGTPDKLTLKVASGTTATPSASVQACPLKSGSFSPEQGGPMSDAPAYDCTQKAAGTADSAGTSFSFSVGSLVKDGALDVAIVPGDATSRVVFGKPDSSSLDTSSGSSSSVGVVTTGDSGTTAPAGSTATGSTPAAPAAPPLPAQPLAAAPGSGQAPVVAASPSAAAAPAAGGAPADATTVAAASSGTSVMPRVVGGFVIAGFVLALLLWAFAGGNRGVEPWQPDR